MSEEAPLRDRSHIEKTLMLNEDKPADDFSGNQRQELGGAGWGWESLSGRVASRAQSRGAGVPGPGGQPALVLAYPKAWTVRASRVWP